MNAILQKNISATTMGLIIIGISAIVAYVFFSFAQSGAETVRVVVPEGASREEVASVLAAEFEWDDETRSWFVVTLMSMQWVTLHEPLLRILEEEFEWGEEERDIFLAQEAKILIQIPDILARAIVPGEYFFFSDDWPEFLAEEFIARIIDSHEDLEAYVLEHVSREERAHINELVRDATF